MSAAAKMRVIAHPPSHRFRALLATLTLAAAAARWLPMSVVEAGGSWHRPKPTVVLVHGGWADSSSWSEVVGRLQDDVCTVEVPPNPLRGLVGDAAYLSAYLQTIAGPIVLVGRSYGGAVITNAASGNVNVKALVFVNAFILDQGETIVQLASAQPGSALAIADPTTLFTLIPYPGSPPGDFDAYVLPAVFVDAFANDLPQRTGSVLAATQRPVALSALATASGTPAWRSIPSWALVGTQDRVLPPAQQLIMAERARAHIVKVNASHMLMISRSKEVADLVRHVSQAIREHPAADAGRRNAER
jgi:pimeloyl-ACP methyl ester carboxylesterase